MRELERKIQLLKILIKDRDCQGARIEGEKLIRDYPAHVELNYLMGSNQILPLTTTMLLLNFH